MLLDSHTLDECDGVDFYKAFQSYAPGLDIGPQIPQERKQSVIEGQEILYGLDTTINW